MIYIVQSQWQLSTDSEMCPNVISYCFMLYLCRKKYWSNMINQSNNSYSQSVSPCAAHSVYLPAMWARWSCRLSSSFRIRFFTASSCRHKKHTLTHCTTTQPRSCTHDHSGHLQSPKQDPTCWHKTCCDKSSSWQLYALADDSAPLHWSLPASHLAPR